VLFPDGVDPVAAATTTTTTTCSLLLFGTRSTPFIFLGGAVAELMLSWGSLSNEHTPRYSNFPDAAAPEHTGHHHRGPWADRCW